MQTNVFISGHSLVDRPFPDHLAAIALGAGTPIHWNRQYLPGSSILARTRGVDAVSSTLAGYRAGIDRYDRPVDVLAELRAPSGIEAGRYDVLLITEQHGLLSSLIWSDSLRALRHFHDQFIRANPQGRTFFYEPWLGLNDKSDPRRWIEYERAASPVWQCIVDRVNQSLALQGRTDRIVSVPVGLALAELICAATTGSGVENLSRQSVRDTVDALLHDDVHTTEAGSYFAAAVTYAAIFRRNPVAAAAPAALSPALATTLRQFAWAFVRDHDARQAGRGVAACEPDALTTFNAVYSDYVYETYYRRELGWLRGRARWLRQRILWHWLLSRENQTNPLYLEPGDDGKPWS